MGQLVTLAECSPGLFIHSGELGFKSEYTRDDGSVDAYVVRTGEAFWGPQPQSVDNQRACLVEPVSDLAIRSARVPTPVDDFLFEVAEEVERAAMLHPGPNPNLAALTEEVGEVAQALLEARQSMMRFGRSLPEEWENIRTEAVQVAAMAFRITFEGDPSLDVVPE